MWNLLVVWSVFYLFCHAIGRPEVPVTLIWRLHHKVMSGIDKPWGCPSPFNKEACTKWNKVSSAKINRRGEVRDGN